MTGMLELATEPCPHCDDSGYVETVRGGFWTGESMRSTYTICDCPCGQDVQREKAALRSIASMKEGGV